MAKILIHVQHLLGSGHAHRMAALASALAAGGHAVTLASGGRSLPLALGGARLVQLASLRSADATFKDLRDEHDQPITDAWRAQRLAATRDLFADLRPDLLIVELYPFGRSMLRFELEPLLADAATIPRLCSVRDVLQCPADPAKAAQRLAAAQRFDGVLVHGDAAFLPLTASWPGCAALADRLHYTGYVAPSEDADTGAGDDSTGRDEIIVSVGGGAAGATMLAVVGAVAAQRAHAGERWRFRIGNHRTAPDSTNPFIVYEANQPNFAALLGRARLYIGQAGYNSCVDLLRARCPAILVPFADGHEREQTIRATAFAKAGLAQICTEGDLTQATLTAAISAARPPAAHHIACEGAAETAKLVPRWL